MFDVAQGFGQSLDRLEEPLYNRAAGRDSKAYLHHLSRLHDRVVRLLATIESGYAQPPTEASLEEMAILKRQVAEQERRFESFTRKDLVTFNRAAAASGVSQLFVPSAR